MKYGQCCRFYGNMCRHLTVPNDTDNTRMSIDFRVVSTATGGHDPTFDAGVRRGSKAKYAVNFDVGGFYAQTTCPTEVGASLSSTKVGATLSTTEIIAESVSTVMPTSTVSDILNLEIST